MSSPSGLHSEATDLSPHPRNFVVSWRHLLSLLVLALSFYVVPLYQTTPELYAVCTEHEARIYTVDATNSQAQCIVIQRPYIIDRGALRESRNLRSTASDYFPACRRYQGAVELVLISQNENSLHRARCYCCSWSEWFGS